MTLQRKKNAGNAGVISIFLFQMDDLRIDRSTISEEDAHSIARNIDKIKMLVFDQCIFSPETIPVISNAILRRKGRVSLLTI